MITLNAYLFSANYIGSITECLLISFLATLAMTVFSLLVSYATKKNFVEPSLLVKIVHKYISDAPKWLYVSLGYIIHFIVGFMFTAIHMYLYLLFTPAWYNAVFFGLINGVIGAIVWFTVIKSYSDVLNVHLSKYLIQLIFAHVVFALVILYMYVLPRAIS